MDGLTKNQVLSLLEYRKRVGPLISLMELQAVPLWDIQTIKKMIPYLTIAQEELWSPAWKQRYREGVHSLTYRTSGRAIENYSGLNGSMPLLLGYRFGYQDLLQWGFTAEKDGGERSFPDHWSMYVVWRKWKWVRDIVAGDFTVNMGQGLIHWQGFALGRSGALINAFRQGEFFRAHTGTDENRYHRGIGITIGKNRKEISLFLSRRLLDGNRMEDSIEQKTWISSILYSGIHRTQQELQNKNAWKGWSVGGRYNWKWEKGRLGYNLIYHGFEIPIIKRKADYNHFEIEGKSWYNMSLDVNHAGRWGMIFGEAAMDKKRKPAFTAGWIKSLDAKLDLILLYRNIPRAYRAFESNANTSSGEAENEKGIWIGMQLKPAAMHSMELGADRYQRDGITYFNDSRTWANALVWMYKWTPQKTIECYVRFQHNVKTQNSGYVNRKTNEIDGESLTRWRFHFSIKPLPWLMIRTRNEMASNWEKKKKTNGTLSYAECIIKPTLKNYSISIRHTVFHTDGYSSRIYAYERDLPAYFAVPAFYEKGSRTYFLMQYKVGDRVSMSGKWIMHQQSNLRRHEWRLQIICNLTPLEKQG